MRNAMVVLLGAICLGAAAMGCASEGPGGPDEDRSSGAVRGGGDDDDGADGDGDDGQPDGSGGDDGADGDGDDGQPDGGGDDGQPDGDGDDGQPDGDGGDPDDGTGVMTGGPACTDDFGVGQHVYTCPDCGIGQACDGDPPRNCADGTYVWFADGSCTCVALCSPRVSSPQPR